MWKAHVCATPRVAAQPSRFAQGMTFSRVSNASQNPFSFSLCSFRNRGHYVIYVAPRDSKILDAVGVLNPGSILSSLSLLHAVQMSYQNQIGYERDLLGSSSRGGGADMRY
jgi:hypothetical protein